MKVTLISHTQDAVNLLLFTKSTRLNLSPGLMDEIRAWPEERKAQELEYMSRTIKSSWEFCDLVFLIEGVTRATAQQMTRTRNASYAMQSQRVTDARSIAVTNNLEAHSNASKTFDHAVRDAKTHYSRLVDAGVPLEEARGVLPMNVQCNLIAKYNLRALSDLIKARKSLRAQGEYNQIVHDMEACVLEVWPWVAPFFVSDKQIAIGMLEGIAKEIGVTTGKGIGWEIAKAIDLIRKD
jgi:flavin-dependent thymidylate synthase